MVQVGSSDVKVWGIFSYRTLGPFVPIKHCLDTTAELTTSIHLEALCNYLLTVTSSKIICHVTISKLISLLYLLFLMSLLENDKEVTAVKLPLQLPNLSSVEHFEMLWNRKFASLMCSVSLCSDCVMISIQYGAI